MTERAVHRAGTTALVTFAVTVVVAWWVGGLFERSVFGRSGLAFWLLVQVVFVGASVAVVAVRRAPPNGLFGRRADVAPDSLDPPSPEQHGLLLGLYCALVYGVVGLLYHTPFRGRTGEAFSFSRAVGANLVLVGWYHAIALAVVSVVGVVVAERAGLLWFDGLGLRSGGDGP